jgi:hypothetical protein
MLFIFILITSLFLQFLLPWWVIAPVAFIYAAWKGKTAGHAFGAGFGAISSLWIIVGLFKTLPNDNLLANRVGQLLGLPELSFNWIIVLVITGIIGGLTSGLAALAGFYARQAIVH